MPPISLREGKPYPQVTKKEEKQLFIALFYQNQIDLVTLNSVIPLTTTAGFPMRYFNNCRYAHSC